MSYKPGHDQWQPLSRPRENGTGRYAVVWENRILLLMTCELQDTTVIEYNPHSDTWTDLKHLLPEKNCLALLQFSYNDRHQIYH